MATKEYQVKIESMSFHEKEKFNAKPVIYFWRSDVKNVMEMVGQRYTPSELFKPHVEDILKPIGLGGAKFKWDQYAGCSCPCSPGFKVDARNYEFDIHVNYTIEEVRDEKAKKAGSDRSVSVRSRT